MSKFNDLVKNRPKWQIITAAVGAVFVALLVIGAVFGDKKEPESTASESAITATSSAAPTSSTPATTTTPESTTAETEGPTMPAVVGKNLKETQGQLEAAGLTIETVDATGKGRSVFQPNNWKVTGQSIREGDPINKGDTVTLEVLKDGEKPGAAEPKVPKSEPEAPKPKFDDETYAASVRQSILDGAGLTSFTEACGQGIDWICYIADVSASTDSIVIVTVQISEKDKAFGARVARSVYNFAGGDHPNLEWVQVNNASGNVIANDRFR